MAQDKRPIQSDSRRGFAKEQSIGQNGEAQNLRNEDTQRLEKTEHARNKAEEGIRQGRDTDELREQTKGDRRSEEGQ